MIINGKNSIDNQKILKTISIPVESAQEAKSIIEKLKPLLKKDHCLGLAAIQIGINKKVGVIKVNEDYLYLINSEIIAKEDEFLYCNEGCLSFPGLFCNTLRYQHITIKNYRIEDDKLEEEKLYFYYPVDSSEDVTNKNKIVSICVQHEIDHFDGKILVDYGVKNQPIVKLDKKVGRNDPCPCGSLKKFKKCCGV